MVRLILLVILFGLVFIGVVAAALFHFFGWKGLLAFPFIVLALIWLGKALIGKVLKRFALSLFSMKSGVLRGATMTVHSVSPISAPEELKEVPPEAKGELADGHEQTDETDNGEEEEEEEADEEAEAEEDEEPEKPKHYYAVDLTITPQAGCGDRVWEPGEFILTSERIKSLEDLEDGTKEVGSTHGVEIWDGSKFGPDDAGKYPGEQRLKVTFAIVPGTSKAWLHYYDEAIGSLDLPRWTGI
jgi:hypothetical protein